MDDHLPGRRGLGLGLGLGSSIAGRVWAFLGDGEVDEPESLGAIGVAAREELDNLTFVVNCNLQRLDGPVRGNGKIIQELGSYFRGAGWTDTVASSGPAFPTAVHFLEYDLNMTT